MYPFEMSKLEEENDRRCKVRFSSFLDPGATKNNKRKRQLK